MKRQRFLLTAATVVLSLAFCFDAGSLRCEPAAESLTNAKSQPRVGDRIQAKKGDQDLQEEKSQRFQVLEFLIIQRLMSQYQQMEVAEPSLEDNLD